METVIDQALPNKETKIDQLPTMVSGRRGARRGVLETISDPKLRRVTFLKRKKNQKKKLYELTTLCDVEAFMMCFGPNGEVDTWPEDPRELRRVLDRYMGIEKSEREKRVMGVADFVDARKKKLERELKRVKKENEERSNGIFGWDSRIDGFDEESMKGLLCLLENNIKFLNEKIETMKSSHANYSTTHHIGSTSKVINKTSFADHQITPNYIFDDPQFFNQTDPQFPIFDEPPLMYPMEYNTQFVNNSQFFINSSHIGEAVGIETRDPTMRSSLIINPFTAGTVCQAKPMQAIMPPLGLPPLTNPTNNYNFQNFDFNPYGSWF